MKHTSSGQTSSNIAETGIFNVNVGRSIMGKAEYRDFDVLTYLNLGRTDAIGRYIWEISDNFCHYLMLCSLHM